ncbi:MAG TPA: guanylate kinase [Rhodanobacteraceae bacterium]|nr:guanylate kinase [Rhodanobacteraceae bacterium]
MAGTLFVVAAPSGAGKSTLVNALLAREPGIRLSISHTTRAPRAGESEGSHYHFVSRETFQAMIDAGQFFEYAIVHGDMKGTSLTAVAPLLEQGQDVLLEIDWQGARQVRAKVPECQSIFILPPSRAELEHRLRKRATDSEASIERRLHDSRAEISHAEEFDYILVNDVFETALDDMQAIVHAVRLRTPLQRLRHAGLIAELLDDPAREDASE